MSLSRHREGQNIENGTKVAKLKFHLGLGSFFCVYDKSNNSVMRQVVEAGMGIHYCLDYPGSSIFFKKNTSKWERSNIDVISRVPCFDTDVMKNEVALTLKELDIGQVETLQLWGGSEVFDCYKVGSELHQSLVSLQNEGKINNFLPQLYYDQTTRLAQNFEKQITPLAFYGSPVGLHIDERLIKKNDVSNSIAMSIFGGVDKGVSPSFTSSEEKEYWDALIAEYSWTEICLMNLQSFGFISNVVGSTGKAERMKEIIHFFDDKKTIESMDFPILNKISIQSCTQEHAAVVNAQATWNTNHERLRSNKVFAKSLVYFYVKKYRWLHKLVNFVAGRS